MKNKEILTISLEKNFREYSGFLLLILTLEIFMVFYALFTFDFTETRRIIYFITYLSLIIITIISFLINYIFLKKKPHKNIAYYNAFIYVFILVIWSALISSLDIIGGGYAVTYMTILAAVGSLIAFHPLSFIFLTIISSSFMIVIVKCFGETILGIPFYLNHLIFLIVAVTVEMRNYVLTSKQIALNRQLEDQANKDGLTNIFNRRYLDLFINELLAKKEDFVFVLIDVDDFKNVNDKFGHQKGDNSLVTIANILIGLFGDKVFRYGGDEFAIISNEKVDVVFEKLTSVNQSLIKNDSGFKLQISAGIFHNVNNCDEKLVFELADKALYTAKNSGKGCIIISK